MREILQYRNKHRGEARLHNGQHGIPPDRAPRRVLVMEHKQAVEERTVRCAQLPRAVRQGNEKHGVEQRKKPIIQQEAHGAAAGKAEKRFQSGFTPFYPRGKYDGK